MIKVFTAMLLDPVDPTIPSIVLNFRLKGGVVNKKIDRDSQFTPSNTGGAVMMCFLYVHHFPISGIAHKN